MDQISLHVPIISDGHFLRAAFEQAKPAVPIKVRFTLYSSHGQGRDAPPSDIDQPTSLLGKVVASNGTACQHLAVDFKDGGSITLVRTENPQRVAVSGFNDEMFGIDVHARLQRALAAFRPGIPFTEALGADLAKYYAAREATLSRLEDSIASLLRSATADLEKRDGFFREKEVHLEHKLATRIKELDTERAVEKEAFLKKEAELAARVKDVDDRASKFARRAIQEKLKKEIKERQTKSELTAGTRKMRLPIMVALSLLGLVLGFGFYAYTAEIIAELAKPAPTSSYILGALFVRQILLGAALGVTVWYFIHWQNQWFERHADEEFKIKRLELDLDRASWVVELAMEWAKETNGKDLPPAILSELAKNLFEDAERAKRPVGDTSALATLLGASTSTEISAGGNKFTLNRKGAERVKAALAESAE